MQCQSVIVRTLFETTGNGRTGGAGVSTSIPFSLFSMSRSALILARVMAKHVWNRDSRAGGVTEAKRAGALTEDAMHLAQHSSPKSTERYSRDNEQKVISIAQLRAASRG